MSLTFTTATAAEHKAVRAFVLSQRSQGSLHQLPEWAYFQHTIPGREQYKIFIAKKSHDIVATMLCVQMDTGILQKFWWYAPRGPVSAPDITTEESHSFLQYIHRELQHTGGIFWRLDPYWSESEAKQWLRSGAKRSLQQYQPTDTLLLNLQQSHEELLSQMKRKGRYNIGLAEKKGVTVEVLHGAALTPADIASYIALQKETTARDGFQSHTDYYYQQFCRCLSPYVYLCFAVYEGVRVAGAVLTLCGDKAIYYFGASTSAAQYRSLMAPYLLQWRMICLAKEHGALTYDFLGIAPEGEENHAYAGITQFKEKFGGERAHYAPATEYPLRRLWYWLYRLAKWQKRSRNS